MILIRGDIARVHPAAKHAPCAVTEDLSTNSRSLEHFPDGLPRRLAPTNLLALPCEQMPSSRERWKPGAPDHLVESSP